MWRTGGLACPPSWCYLPQVQLPQRQDFPQGHSVRLFMSSPFTPADARLSRSLHFSRMTTQALVDNHRKFLAFIEKRVGDRALAEDILQDAFVKSLEKGDEIRDETSSVAWFYRLLRNAIIDQYRRRATRSKALESLAAELKDAIEPPAELRDEICGCVREIASTLKAEYADAIRRVDVEDVPVQSFAAEVGISASNAGVRLFRAREALRKQVTSACGTCAEHGCLECHCKLN